jgi:hypothetical protein
MILFSSYPAGFGSRPLNVDLEHNVTYADEAVVNSFMAYQFIVRDYKIRSRNLWFENPPSIPEGSRFSILPYYRKSSPTISLTVQV